MSSGDFTGLIDAMKRAAVGAVDAAKPVAVLFGRVASASPLRVAVEQKLTLEAGQLVLCRAVTDHDVRVAGSTEPMRVLGGLRVGEEVIMLRVQGGQRFIVLDRIGGG